MLPRKQYLKPLPWICLIAITFPIALIYGCGNGGRATQSEKGKTGAEKKTASGFVLKDINGKESNLDTFLKEGDLVISFWATWCPHCRKEVPQLSSLHQKMKSKLQIIGISIQEKEETVKKFVEENKISYPIFIDKDGSVAKSFGILGIPTNVVVGKDRIIKNPHATLDDIENLSTQVP